MAGKFPMSSKMKKIACFDDNSDDEYYSYTSSDSEAELELFLSKLKIDSFDKKKLLVLPLGGFLVHRVHLRNKASVYGYKPDYAHAKFLLFKRPFSSDFLKFCFERFEVAIWSSAKEHNVDAAISALFGPVTRKFAFIWDQEECTNSGFSSLENGEKPIFLKELTKMCEKLGKGKYSSANTLLICEPTNALLNPPNTSISLSDFKVNNRGADSFLGPEGAFGAYLDEIVKAEDVPTLCEKSSLWSAFNNK